MSPWLTAPMCPMRKYSARMAGCNPPARIRTGIYLAPRPATPQAATPLSATAPPTVPEPFIYQAHSLIHLTAGEVVARKLYCVIY